MGEKDAKGSDEQESAPAETASEPAGALVEPAEQALERLERELGEWKDRAMRAAADHDNFRKRAAREREEAWSRAQSDVAARILDVVDDLARVAHLDPEKTSPLALHEGMALVERKFLKVLEGIGLERVDPMGEPFDPESHEAVTAMPAPSQDADHTVGMVFQHGYRLKGTLLRPARVAVLQWQQSSEQGSEKEAAS